MSSDLPGFFQGTEMPNAGWWEALWPDPASVLAAIGIKSGMDVVDLCSGDGWFTLQIAKIANRVVAIDIDAALLETARHRLSEGGITNCEFVAGDAYELVKLAPRPADLVFMANAFHGVPDQTASCPGRAWSAKAGRPLRRRELASAPARANNRPRGAARTQDGTPHVTAANHRSRRTESD